MARVLLKFWTWLSRTNFCDGKFRLPSMGHRWSIDDPSMGSSLEKPHRCPSMDHWWPSIGSMGLRWPSINCDGISIRVSLFYCGWKLLLHYIGRYDGNRVITLNFNLRQSKFIVCELSRSRSVIKKQLGPDWKSLHSCWSSENVWRKMPDNENYTPTPCHLDEQIVLWSSQIDLSSSKNVKKFRLSMLIDTSENQLKHCLGWFLSNSRICVLANCRFEKHFCGLPETNSYLTFQIFHALKTSLLQAWNHKEELRSQWRENRDVGHICHKKLGSFLFSLPTIFFFEKLMKSFKFQSKFPKICNFQRSQYGS